ncbi:MAG: radical SAM protein [Acidobacteriota bacterium]
MRILLVAPASGNWHHVGRAGLFSGRVFRFSMLSLLTVAAETPPGVELDIVDEQLDEIRSSRKYDLVGISVMTATAPRAYEIARSFRRMGVPVVLGGMHASFMPEEALQYGDAVCIGEAEGVWPQVVSDARATRLKPVYRADAPHSLRGLNRPPRHLLAGRRYATLQAVQATRGCPHRCAFCSVSAFHDGMFRARPVGQVLDEVKELPGRFFIFVDDSLTADPDYARALFAGLIPLGKHWMSQATLGITDDADLVRLAADSGCVGLFVGIETFSNRNLESVEKGFNRVDEYRERVRMLHASGIGVEAGIVFGFDSDGPEVFSEALRLLAELEIDMIQVSILTPLPGTPWFRAMSDRIVDRDWTHYDYHHAVFEPKRMSREQLKAGHDWITSQFYRPDRILKRLARLAARGRCRRSLPYAAALNGAYYGRVRRWHIRGWIPAALEVRPQSSQSPSTLPSKRRLELT